MISSQENLKTVRNIDYNYEGEKEFNFLTMKIYANILQCQIIGCLYLYI